MQQTELEGDELPSLTGSVVQEFIAMCGWRTSTLLPEIHDLKRLADEDVLSYVGEVGDLEEEESSSSARSS